MAITIEQYKSLQRYLDDEMTTEEEVEFEKELQAKDELKEYYGFEVGLRNYLDLSQLKRAIPNFSLTDITIEEPFVVSLPDVNKIASVAEIKSGPSKKWIFYAAACIAVIIGGIFLLYYYSPTTQTIAKDEAKKNDTATLTNENQSSLQEAINNKVDSDKKIKETKEKNNDQQTLLALAQQYFSKDTILNERPDTLASNSTDLAKNHRPVIEDSHLPQQQTVDGYAGAMPQNKNTVLDNEKIDYYNKGIDLIEQKRYKQAEEKLQWIIDNSDDENYIGNAQWYLALAYLMEGNKKAALPLLNKVSVDNSAAPYTEKAKKLLSELTGE